MPDFDPARFTLRGWRFSPPTRFGTVYRDRLAQAADIDVFLGANLVHIGTTGSGERATAFEFASLGGRHATVGARCFVLACGALENARLLLATRDVHEGGLGNTSGVLGRYFMQHPERVVGRLLTGQAREIARLFAAAPTTGGGMAQPFVACAPMGREQHGLLGTAFDVMGANARGEGTQALRGIWREIEDGRWPTDLDDRLYRVLRDLDGLAADLGGRIAGEPAAVSILMRSEQFPNPDSRVCLTDTTDRFGIPKLAVDWRLTALDRRSIVEATKMFAAEAGRLGLGRIQLAEWLGEDAWPDPIWSGCHHMGTTRMAADPELGVVDSDCRLHDVANLRVAGGSVFPTGGYVPPTLTIVAMALRMADSIRGELA
jgi:choline dehydrogenase-like flavoprotein